MGKNRNAKAASRVSFQEEIERRRRAKQAGEHRGATENFHRISGAVAAPAAEEERAHREIPQTLTISPADREACEAMIRHLKEMKKTVDIEAKKPFRKRALSVLWDAADTIRRIFASPVFSADFDTLYTAAVLCRKATGIFPTRLDLSLLGQRCYEILYSKPEARGPMLMANFAEFMASIRQFDRAHELLAELFLGKSLPQILHSRNIIAVGGFFEHYAAASGVQPGIVTGTEIDRWRSIAVACYEQALDNFAYHGVTDGDDVKRMKSKITRLHPHQAAPREEMEEAIIMLMSPDFRAEPPCRKRNISSPPPEPGLQ